MAERSGNRLPLLFGLSTTSVLGFIFGEAAIIAVVALLGPLLGFLALSAICAVISTIVVFAYDKGEWSKWGPIERVNRWVRRREGNMSRLALKLAKVSWVLAFLFSTVTAGPFVTVILLKVIGRPQTNSYLLALASSLVFSATWTAIYSGFLLVVTRVLF